MGDATLSFFKFKSWNVSGTLKNTFQGADQKANRDFVAIFQCFSLFVYLFYKPPALFATCKVTKILGLPTPSILIPAQISMIRYNTSLPYELIQISWPEIFHNRKAAVKNKCN